MLRLRRMLRAGVLGGGGVAPPAAPSGLTATAVSPTQIDLEWDDNAGTETGYRVYRSTDGETYAVLVELPADTTSYSDTDCEAGTQYWYKVSAYNAGGDAVNNGATATTPVALTLTATTTGASQSVTLHRMTPADGKTLTVSWGDGSADTVISAGDTSSKAHTYASAGTYSISVTNAQDIVQINLHDARLGGFNSAELANSAITYFNCYSLGSAVASVVSSAHMAAWSPTNWQLYSMPAGTYSIDSAHMAAWSPTYWQLYSMPAGTYSIDSAHMATWSPKIWYLSSMPAGTLTVTAAADFNGWVQPINFRFDNLSLNQTQVDAILTGLYGAFAGKTSTGGTLNLGGSGGTNNAAPSGTFQAASACPPTDGKEIAYELLNDTCDVSTKHWATVTITS